MSEKVQIIIATHKNYWMPEDSIYLPLHVGREGKEDLGFTGDNTGDNISYKNPSFCELTGLYWAWKNLDAEYVGLAHYRRHFVGNKKKKDFKEKVLTSEYLLPELGKYKVFVPSKRNYYIETLYSHYAHTHYPEHLDKSREIISRIYPDYLKCFDTVLRNRSGYMFNMMIMTKPLMDDYCQWLFDILFELEKEFQNSTSNLSFFHGRFYGRVSEILFNVWLSKKIEENTISESDIKEIPFVYTEKIDWFRKIKSFIEAKFLHKKYEKSF